MRPGKGGGVSRGRLDFDGLDLKLVNPFEA